MCVLRILRYISTTCSVCVKWLSLLLQGLSFSIGYQLVCSLHALCYFWGGSYVTGVGSNVIEHDLELLIPLFSFNVLGLQACIIAPAKFIFFLLLFCFWDRVPLCNIGWPETWFVDQTNLQLKDLPSSAFHLVDIWGQFEASLVYIGSSRIARAI